MSLNPLSLSRQLKDGLKGAAVQSQDKSRASVQKRPVRPILPAYYTTGETNRTAHKQCSVVKISCHLIGCMYWLVLVFLFLGRTLFQILTVPPDKEKLQSANNNKSSTGTVHYLILFEIIPLLVFHSVVLEFYCLFVQCLLSTHRLPLTYEEEVIRLCPYTGLSEVSALY